MGTKNYCKRSITLYEQELHEIVRIAIIHVTSQELLLEALIDSADEAGLPELYPELTVMFRDDPPVLTEYNDE